MAGLPANDAVQFRGRAGGRRACLTCRRSTWPEAVALLSRLPADALLQELACPGARRFEAVKRLRGWPPPLSRLAVVALAGQQERGAGDDLHRGRLRCAADPARWTTAALEAALRRIVGARTPASPLDADRCGSAAGGTGGRGPPRPGRRWRWTAPRRWSPRLRTTPALPDVQDAAGRVAAAFEAVGAPAAVAAARALEAAPERRPVLLRAADRCGGGGEDGVAAGKVRSGRESIPSPNPSHLFL